MTAAAYSDSQIRGFRHHRHWSKILPADQPYVYFIQGNPRTAIKVGFTTNVNARLNALQTSNWQPLRLLVVLPADRHVEAAYHKRLDSERVRGEWFEGPKTNDLLESAKAIADTMVASHNEGASAPDIYAYDRTLRRPAGMIVPPENETPAERRQREIRERRERRKLAAKEWGFERPAADQQAEAPPKDWVVDFPEERALRPRNYGGYTPFR